MAERLKEAVQSHFKRLVEEGCDANDAFVKAVALAKEEVAQSAEQPKAPAEGAVAPGQAATAAGAGVGAAGTNGEQPQPPPSTAAPGSAAWAPPNASVGASKYGPLCHGLAGPFQSICITGTPRPGKKLLVLDIDHTIYDPSDYGGSKGSVVKADKSGFFDESMIQRCRPGLHEFLTEVYKSYDLMVWSASDMIRILTLLQQLGMVGGGHTDYQVVAVLDIDSMSELNHSKPQEGGDGGDASEPAVAASPGAMVQTVVVPPGAVPGQQIEARSIKDGAAMVVTVPPGLKPGDEFHVAIPGAVTSVSEELGIDAEDVRLALQLSMGAERPDAAAASSSSSAGGDATAAAAGGGDGAGEGGGEQGGGSGAAAASAEASGGGGDGFSGGAPLAKARRKGRRVKPLSLVWACREFSDRYTETNTIIVDDTVDVCSANPHHSIQCTRYFLQDHETDAELRLLTRYLVKIAQSPELPSSHTCWRDGL